MPDTETGTAREDRYAWTIAATAMLVVTGALGFGRFGYAMLLPSMSEGLGLTAVQAADIATGNMIGYLASALACGLLSSRFGPRAVITVSIALVAAALLATGAAVDYGSAFAARLLTGVASAGANVPVMGLLSAWFTARRRGLASGMAVGGSSLGLAVTGILVPAILAAGGADGWRTSWIALAAITAMISVLCLLLLRNGPRLRPSLAPSAPREAPSAAARGILASPRLWLLGGVYLLFGFAYVIFSTFYVRFLTAERGFSTSAAGAVWSAIGVVSIASGFLWGSVSDRLGRARGLAIVFGLQAAAFASLGAWRALPGAMAAALLFSLTAWSIPAIIAAAAGDIAGPRMAPGALGFMTVFFGAGQAAGPAVAGRIAEAAGTYAPAFLAASTAAVAGGLFALMIGRRGGRRA